MSGKRVTGSNKGVGSFSGSIDTFKEPSWRRYRESGRTFKRGDLVTLAPEFRYTVSITEPDMGRYIGIVIEEYSNREYVVFWTAQPLVTSQYKGMYNGDHLVKLEHAVDLE